MPPPDAAVECAISWRPIERSPLIQIRRFSRRRFSPPSEFFAILPTPAAQRVSSMPPPPRLPFSCAHRRQRCCLAFAAATVMPTPPPPLSDHRRRDDELFACPALPLQVSEGCPPAAMFFFPRHYKHAARCAFRDGGVRSIAAAEINITPLLMMSRRLIFS